VWENKDVFISHAGISQQADDPFDEDSELGVLWNRSRLKNIDKLQIIGHTPCEKPVHDKESNSWNIDTGAAFNGFLTGVKITSTGEIIDFVKEVTDPGDVS
jgi:serine/threonine protein phosphatase 1